MRWWGICFHEIYDSPDFPFSEGLEACGKARIQYGTIVRCHQKAGARRSARPKVQRSRADRELYRMSGVPHRTGLAAYLRDFRGHAHPLPNENRNTQRPVQNIGALINSAPSSCRIFSALSAPSILHIASVIMRFLDNAEILHYFIAMNITYSRSWINCKQQGVSLCCQYQQSENALPLYAENTPYGKPISLVRMHAAMPPKTAT